MTVAAMLSEKGRDVITTSAAASIAGAIDTLAKHKIGALVVVDDAGQASPASSRSATSSAPSPNRGAESSPRRCRR